jgi:hypothetical protein
MHYNNVTTSSASCDSNYTVDSNSTFNSAYSDDGVDDDWLIRMNDPFVSGSPYSSKDGVIEVNKMYTWQFRIWICVKCTSGFQSATTMPFMIDVQCGTASTVMSIASTHSLSSSNAYNSQI